MEIISFGGGGRLTVAKKLLSERGEGSCRRRLVLLPIPSSRDKEHITGTDVTLSEAAHLCGEGTLLAGYNMPEELPRLAVSLGAEVYDAAFDEDFLCENAEITAYGALGRILCDGKRAPNELSVGVIGYGRIGKRITRYLLFLGAGVTVFSGRESVRAELGEAGLDTRPFPTKDFSGLDLIINTAPSKVMSEETLEALPDEVKIMELASGNNFPPSSRVIKLASVPDAMYPETAGGIYAKYVSKYI